jgi:hypothetical protein
MNTLTIRKIPVSIEQRLRQIARNSHQSINKTTIDLLAKAVGLDSESKFLEKQRDVKSAIKQWTDDEYKDFQNNTKIFEQIDEAMWRK